MKHVSTPMNPHRVMEMNRRPRRSVSLFTSLFWMIHCINKVQAQSIIIITDTTTTSRQAQDVDYADFLVTSDRSNIMNTAEHFVARITDPIMIDEARAELEKKSGYKIISGTIEKTPVDWNPGWSYHLTPSTIFFGDFFIQICDASATYIEENLSEAGESFLPRLQWCPWGTRVLKEITSSVPSPPSPPLPPTMAPAQPPKPTQCAARGEICTDKMPCCSTDDICRGICARKTTNTKAGDKSNLKLDYDDGSDIRGTRTGGGGTRHRQRQRRLILKGSS